MNAKQQPTAAGGGDSFIAIWKCVATCWEAVRTRAHSNCSTNGERGETILPFDLFHIGNEVWRAAIPHRSASRRVANAQWTATSALTVTTRRTQSYSLSSRFISLLLLWKNMSLFCTLFFSLHKFSIRKLWCLILRWLLTDADPNQSFFVCVTMNFKLDCRPNSNSRSANNQASSRNNSFPFCGKFKAIVS